MNASINGTENMNEEQINFNDDEVIKVSQFDSNVRKIVICVPEKHSFREFSPER